MSVARVYRLGTTFNGSELAEVDYEQSADTMYLAHIDHAPQKLVREDHTSWVFSDLTFSPTITVPTGVTATATQPNTDAANSGNASFPQDAKYVVTALDDGAAQESRASSTVTANNCLTLSRNYNTVAWSAVSGAERYRVYKANNTGSFGYIGTTTSTSFRDDNIGPDFSVGPPEADNPFPDAGNYPSTVCFYEQRLMWGRTNNNPNAVYASRSGDYENMDISRPLRDSDSFSFRLVAGRVNAVNQLVALDSLIAITSDSIFKITGGQDGYLGPTTFNSRRQNGRGGSRLSSLVVDSNAFYQTSVGNVIRVIGYEFETDSTQSNDITIFSPHLFRDFGLVAWAFAQEPRAVIYAVRDDGKALCFTWEKEQQVWGWTVFETDGLYKDVTVISENGEDRAYWLVERNGNLLIERSAAATWDGVEDCCFLDSAVTYFFEAPATVCRNLEHLEGLTVSALADGAVINGLVVTGGQVTLDEAVSKVTVGLPYTTAIQTLPLAIDGGKGMTLAKRQTTGKVVLRLIESRGVRVGPSENRLETLRSRHNEAPGTLNPLLSGMYEVTMKPEISDGVRVWVQSDDPLPLTVTGIYFDPSVSE